ncbi:MAG: beta-galactosidase [Eubacteriales bacterium]
MKRKHLLYGMAYYNEYMPSERIEEDIKLFQEANINVIRIAESTWSTEEPEEGVFDFHHIESVLEATMKAGISVIVGTPTYAIPPWLAKRYPEVIVTTKEGKDVYGRRQNMDITHPAYLFYGERIIRKLMECVTKYPNVIGVQLDNETKHYDTCSDNVVKKFIAYLRNKFVTIDALNHEFGFNYWSNRVDSWENIPSPVGTINGSFGAEFAKFQRVLVDEFLMWESNIVSEYLTEEQFITHNFDFEWRGHSYGMQTDVNHKTASKAVTLAGCDIYHNTQNLLTGKEIALGGDIMRSLKDDNYFVLETQAQGQVQWLPYNGQIRLQAFSHIASGANSVMYWHWHSIHNSFETYWKGILSHDLQKNRVYEEVSTVGRDFHGIGSHLLNLKKENKVAVLISNEAATGLDWFQTPDNQLKYNDFLRWVYDSLFELNVEVDILFPQDGYKFNQYKMIVVPTLYSADDALLEQLSDFCISGGTLVGTFKTGFANEYLTVPAVVQPRKLVDCFGISYNEYTMPVDTSLVDDDFQLNKDSRKISVWMELLKLQTATAISYYDNESFGKYAAVTKNHFGKGNAYYIGCYTSKEYLKSVFSKILKENNLWSHEQDAGICIKQGVNDFDKKIVFFLNYSAETKEIINMYGTGEELLSQTKVEELEQLQVEPWGVKIIEI